MSQLKLRVTAVAERHLPLIRRYGCAIAEKSDRWYIEGRRYEPYGTHGYDRDHEDMHGIFIAHGPFADHIKASTKERIGRVFGLRPTDDELVTVLPGFDNLELYNLVTKHMLGLPTVAPNNGTVGFWQSLVQD